MKRFPAFDPPEYVSWRPYPELAGEYSETWSGDAQRSAVIDALSVTQKLDLYRGMVRARLHDIALKRWVKQGVISKAWLGTGEEAVTIGPVHALNRDVDVVAPMIRNAAACCEMGLSVADMLRGYLATADSPSQGRDGHVGSLPLRVLEPISNIGNIPPVTVGIALSFRLRGVVGVAMTWVGDGSVKSGPTHEAFNFAAVQELPAIFIIQNNQVAWGTPVEGHHLPGTFERLHEADGMAGRAFDGNHVPDGDAAAKHAAVEIEEPELCRRDCGRVLGGIRIGPSPAWMVQRLAAARVRSLHNAPAAPKRRRNTLGKCFECLSVMVFWCFSCLIKKNLNTITLEHSNTLGRFFNGQSSMSICESERPLAILNSLFTIRF